MRNLSESLECALRTVNEAGNLLVVCFDHSSPESTFVIQNCTQADVKKLQRTAFDCIETLPNPQGLVVMSHNDESISLQNVPYNNLNQIKTYCWDTFQQYAGDIDDGYLEEVDMPDIDVCLSFDDADKIKNAGNLWKRVSDFFTNSEIDGDSSRAYAIIDPKNQETLLGGAMSISYYDDFTTFYDEMFGEV